VIAVLSALGLDPTAPSLKQTRDFFRQQNVGEYISKIFRLAGISTAVMTNDPLDGHEQSVWHGAFQKDERFEAALRLDRILNDWHVHWRVLEQLGYPVSSGADGTSAKEVRRFLEEWTRRMDPAYMAVSLPDTFVYPAEDTRTRLIREAVLPACRDANIPLALMIGVRRQVNPAIRLAGDGVGRADLRAVEALCRGFPDNRFLITVLSRENQHELCVLARKFSNLLPFGCWWFMNNPSIVDETTRERIEMLGMSFIPQHSDARILEQLIYKWRNTRRTMLTVLTSTYTLLAQDGRPVTREDIQHDVKRLFRTNFESVTNGSVAARLNRAD
jgi:hypothetical protein